MWLALPCFYGTPNRSFVAVIGPPTCLRGGEGGQREICNLQFTTKCHQISHNGPLIEKKDKERHLTLTYFHFTQLNKYFGVINFIGSKLFPELRLHCAAFPPMLSASFFCVMMEGRRQHLKEVTLRKQSTAHRQWEKLDLHPFPLWQEQSFEWGVLIIWSYCKLDKRFQEIVHSCLLLLQRSTLLKPKVVHWCLESLAQIPRLIALQ